MPSSCSSKQPTSSVAPYRFFTPRTRRSRACRSPSKCSTTSTRCSSSRGPGDGAVLGDMADQQRGHAALLGGADQRAGHLADLRHAARRAVDLGGGDGLHRVEDQQGRLHRVQVAEDGGQVGLGGEIEVVVERADPVGAQPHLARGLLAGDVERAVLVARPPWPPRPAAAWTCRRPARPRAAPPRRAPARRRAPGPARARRWSGRWPAGRRPGRWAARRWRPGRAPSYARRARRTPRPCPRPGTRGSGRATWRSPAALGAAVGRPVLGGLRTGSHGRHRSRGALTSAGSGASAAGTLRR